MKDKLAIFASKLTAYLNQGSEKRARYLPSVHNMDITFLCNDEPEQFALRNFLKERLQIGSQVGGSDKALFSSSQDHLLIRISTNNLDINSLIEIIDKDMQKPHNVTSEIDISESEKLVENSRSTTNQI